VPCQYTLSRYVIDNLAIKQISLNERTMILMNVTYAILSATNISTTRDLYSSNKHSAHVSSRRISTAAAIRPIETYRFVISRSNLQLEDTMYHSLEFPSRHSFLDRSSLRLGRARSPPSSPARSRCPRCIGDAAAGLMLATRNASTESY